MTQRGGRAWGERLPQLWTQRQLAALLLMTAAILAVGAVRWWMNPVLIDDPQGHDAPGAAGWDDRLDPNTVDMWQLAALPRVGPSLATRIVEYREEYRATHPGRRPFETLDDLMRVKGVGPATVSTLDPYLVFPSTRPASDAR